MASSNQPLDVATLRARTTRRLPRPVFDHVYGGLAGAVFFTRDAGASVNYEILSGVLVDIATIPIGARFKSRSFVRTTRDMKRCARVEKMRGAVGEDQKSRAGHIYALGTNEPAPHPF